MITIEHGKYAIRVTSDPDLIITDFRDVHRYVTGWDKPNYPMPAIPVITLWGRDWCAQYKGWLGNPIDMPYHCLNFWY